MEANISHNREKGLFTRKPKASWTLIAAAWAREAVALDR